MDRPTTNLSINELERIIHARQKELRKLEKHRGKWQKQLDKVNAQIRSLTGNGKSSSLRAPTRVRNEVSLTEVVYRVLADARSPLGIGEIAQKVLTSGYHSNSKSFRTVVNADQGQAIYESRPRIVST